MTSGSRLGWVCQCWDATKWIQRFNQSMAPAKNASHTSGSPHPCRLLPEITFRSVLTVQCGKGSHSPYILCRCAGMSGGDSGSKWSNVGLHGGGEGCQPPFLPPGKHHGEGPKSWGRAQKRKEKASEILPFRCLCMREKDSPPPGSANMGREGKSEHLGGRFHTF